MYKLSRNGESLGMTEALTYVKTAANGCYVLCPEPEASGIVFAGVVYHLPGRPELAGTDTVAVEVVDAGSEIKAVNDTVTTTAKISGQMQVATRLYVQATTNIDDDTALEMPDLFKTWEEVLSTGAQLAADTVLNLDGQLYRVVQPVTPQAHQRPDGEGMAAIYRPIEPTHTGGLEDPIPFRYGMDVTEGLYYSSGGKVYLCNLTMPGCVYTPGTPGLWQWSEVTE